MDKKQIKVINVHRITYLDSNGQEVFIDFRNCYKNYLKDRLSSEGWNSHRELNGQNARDWDTYLNRVIDWHEVGWRDISECCIELYTEPAILFEFESVEEFHKIRYSIHKTGWITRDMS
ncbi:MAG: hypothetical protein H7X77_03800 [Anaerolineae bacterium]|nr:hypothetical protein [Anaerolineae bacterium]